MAKNKSVWSKELSLGDIPPFTQAERQGRTDSRPHTLTHTTDPWSAYPFLLAKTLG